MTYFDPDALLADVRRKTATRRGVHLSAEQRAAAYRAKRGPLGWIFTGSSPEDVIADSRTLRKIMRIYKTRPRMRHSSGLTTISLPSGKKVRFHSDTGEVTRP
jgi:hypothetical protein